MQGKDVIMRIQCTDQAMAKEIETKMADTLKSAMKMILGAEAKITIVRE